MALASGNTRNIGVIIPFITNYYFSTVISGIQEVACSNGYNIVLLITNDSAERELNMIRSLSVTSLDGLLFLPVHKEWIIYSGFSVQSGKEDIVRLLECEQIPDAVFAVNDRKAVGAIIALKEKKIRVGKDMGVVGFTNNPISVIIEPSLTTIEEPAFDIGKKSCELLIRHITNKHFLPKEIVLAGTLIVRESSKKIPEKRKHLVC
ncbi:MAG: substrate-binding domain-containing protein [Mangrovibacterium sp.]|nr:substrate-binding domain-containing protein [Mangrovibacterium sp.]